MEYTPHRLLDTSNGRLCDRESLINAFKTSAKYKELLSSTIESAHLREERIRDAVETFFLYVMLSHRWEEPEASKHEIADKVIYELDPVGGIVKLQSFCKVVRDAGYRWAWMDTCCIDQKDPTDIQRSVHSMFAWYRHSALTIIYLSDVPPSSKSGAMARSAWRTRGWTVQELLAPKIVLFYQSDWTLYLDDRSSNHKKSAMIVQELEDATGINGQALTGFQPGMTGAREKLQWASKRVTKYPEDIAYSLFGIFGVHIPIMYGETKGNALGRLLQEIIARSGDISCLDWSGRSSEFNSCLPANITAYAAPAFAPPSLPEKNRETSVFSQPDANIAEADVQLHLLPGEETETSTSSQRDAGTTEAGVQPYLLPPPPEEETKTSTSSLRDAGTTEANVQLHLLPPPPEKGTKASTSSPRDAGATEAVIRLYTTLDQLDGPKFENYRLGLPCIVFTVTHVKQRPSAGQETRLTYEVKAGGLQDLLITTEDKLSRKQKLLLVRPWDCNLLKLCDTADSDDDSDAHSVMTDDSGTSWGKEPADSDSDSRALRLLACLGQPFRALLLVQQGKEFRRIAADYNIVARVKDATSVRDLMDIRTVEIK